MSKLRNCPFCQSSNVGVMPLGPEVTCQEDDIDYMVGCEDCGSGTAPCNTQEEAIALWQGRPTKHDVLVVPELERF